MSPFKKSQLKQRSPVPPAAQHSTLDLKLVPCMLMRNSFPFSDYICTENCPYLRTVVNILALMLMPWIIFAEGPVLAAGGGPVALLHLL